MSKYRILKITHFYGEQYILQRQFLGFLWWYNPDNFDGMITGVYDTLEEAEESYRQKVFNVQEEYLSVKENSDG